MRFLGLWQLPVFLMLAIYLPPALFGIYAFGDVYSFSFLTMLGIFVSCYYGLYLHFAIWLRPKSINELLWRIGDGINWQVMAWIAVMAYVVTLIIATLTVEFTPIGAALRGGDWLDIARARAEFLTNREGLESLLRYSAVILGRAVMPFLVVYAYWSRHKFRHLLLIGLLLCYVISLEKASAIFLFLPLILLSLRSKLWKLAFIQICSLILCIGLWTFLAHGGLTNSHKLVSVVSQQAINNKSSLLVGGRKGDPDRFAFTNLLNPDAKKIQGGEIPSADRALADRAVDEIMFIINRSIWIPYVTAYDWLKFQDEILEGRLTLGRSIGVVSWLFNEPKLKIENMVYEYEFGPPPGGAGASNTVFFVDAKLAFGWAGVVIYCVLFTAFAALIMSSKNEPAKIASITSFFTACLSPLTATLLSGGLFFYILICMLVRPDQREVKI